MQANGFPPSATNGVLQQSNIQAQLQTTNKATRQHLAATLRSKPIPPGWQQTFRLEHRLSFIIQIANSIVLLRANIDNQKALDVALGYEEKAFTTSQDEVEYRNNCGSKLKYIRETRQNQVAQKSNNMNPNMNGNGPMYHQGMINPNHVQQAPQHPASQPGHMNQGVNLAHMGMQPQQPQHPQQQHQQPHMLANGGNMSNVNGMNGHPNMAQPAGPLAGMQQGLQDLTQQERDIVQRMAAQMAANLTEAQRHQLAQNANNVDPRVRQQLQNNGQNILGLFIQAEALKKFRMNKQNQLLQNGGMQMVNGGQQQPPQMGMPQGLNAQQQMMGNGGNINQQHILAQQQEGLRLQQQGQQVVPANQAGGMQQPNQQHFGRQNQWAGQPQGAFQATNQSLWNNRPGGQNQNQANTPNMQQNNLTGQMGGLRGNMGAGPNQQTPTLHTLNQPLQPPNQGQEGLSPRPQQPNPAMQNQPRPPTSNPQQPQANPAGQNQMTQFIASLPPQVKAHIHSLPNDEERKKVLYLLRQRQIQQARAQGQPGMPQNRPQQQVPQQPNMNLPQGNEQPQARMPNGQQPNGQPQNTGGQRQPMPPAQMTQQEMEFMDRTEFPATLKQQNPPLNGLPPNIRTWGDLKNYFAINNKPHLIPQITKQEAQHYAHQQQARVRQQQQQQHQHQHQHQHQQQQQQQQPQPPQKQQNGPTQVPGMAPTAQMNRPQMPTNQMPQIPPQMLQQIRQANPQLADVPDEQLRNFVIQRRMQQQNQQGGVPQNSMNAQQQMQYRDMLRQQQASQRFMNQPNPPNQPPQMPQQAAQPKPAPQKAPPANMNQMNGTTEPPKQVAPTQTAPKAPQRNMKRQNTQDVVEIEDPNLNKQTSANKAAVPPPTQVPRFDPAQFNRLSAEQKRRFIQQQTAQSQPVVQNQVPKSDATVKEEMKRAYDHVRGMVRQLQNSQIGKRPAVPMNARTKNAMSEKLRKLSTSVQRGEAGLAMLWLWQKDEKAIQELARMVSRGCR